MNKERRKKLGILRLYKLVEDEKAFLAKLNDLELEILHPSKHRIEAKLKDVDKLNDLELEILHQSKHRIEAKLKDVDMDRIIDDVVEAFKKVKLNDAMVRFFLQYCP